MDLVHEALSQQARSKATRTLRLQRRLHVLSLLTVDVLSANAAFFLAYTLRYVFELGGDVPGESFVDYATYLPVQLLFVAFCLLVHQLKSSYRLPRGSSMLGEMMSVFTATTTASMVVFALTSMIRYPASSRLTFIYAWLLAFAIGVAARVVVRIVRARLHSAGYGIEHVVVVGSDHLARMIMQMVAQQRHLGYRIVGFVDSGERADFGRFRALGPVSQLPALVDQIGVDHVIVALPANRHEEILWVLDSCQRAGVSLSMVPDLFALRLSHVDLGTVGGIPWFRLSEKPIQGWNLVVKRAIDLAGSTLLLAGLAPLFLVVSVLIKSSSRGPVYFRQVRLGKGGAPFVCYKFRSMRDGADREQSELERMNEADGPIFKIRHDPRLTRVGSFLRRTSIDELPQLWNILRGEMSLVGPRPPIPEEVARYEDWHRRRLEVVPGLTGLWQVSGRSELSFDEMVMFDLYYIENWSLALDVHILARTIPAVVGTSGAF
jgi:exopolysaccharide biosynthesis polyprenyl glycosylphosphotransferase